MRVSVKVPLVADFIATVLQSRDGQEWLQRIAVTHQQGWKIPLGLIYSEVFLQAQAWKELMSRHGVDDIRLGVIATLLMESADLRSEWPVTLQEELEAAVREVLARWDRDGASDKQLVKRLAVSRFWVPIEAEKARVLEGDAEAISIRHTLLLQTAMAFGVGWRSVGESKSLSGNTAWDAVHPYSYSQMFGMASGIVAVAVKHLSRTVPGFERRDRDGQSDGGTSGSPCDEHDITGWSLLLLGQYLDFSNYESAFHTLCRCAAISKLEPESAIGELIDLWEMQRDQFHRAGSLLDRMIQRAVSAKRMISINAPRKNRSKKITENESNRRWNMDYFRCCFGSDLAPNWETLWRRLEDSFGGEEPAHEIMLLLARTRDLLAQYPDAVGGFTASLSKEFLPGWDPLTNTLDDHLQQFILGYFDPRPGAVLKPNALCDSAFGRLLFRERVIVVELVAFDVCAECGEYSFTPADVLEPAFLKSALTELDPDLWGGFLPDVQILAGLASALATELRSAEARTVAEVLATHLNRWLDYETLLVGPEWRRFLERRLKHHQSSESGVTKWLAHFLDDGVKGLDGKKYRKGEMYEFFKLSREDRRESAVRSMVVATVLALCPVGPFARCPIALVPSVRRRSIRGAAWKDRPCGHTRVIVKASPWVFVPDHKPVPDQSWAEIPYYRCLDADTFGEHYCIPTLRGATDTVVLKVEGTKADRIGDFVPTHDTEGNDDHWAENNDADPKKRRMAKTVGWTCACGCDEKGQRPVFLWAQTASRDESSTHLNNDHE